MKKYLLFLISPFICTQILGQTISDQYEIKIINNDLFMEVYVNNQGPYNFIFDTGASGLGRIDERIAKELNLNVVDSIQNYDGSGNYRTEPVMGINKLSVGKISLYNVELMSRDYNRIYKQGDIRTDGIIGRDFFKDYLLVIDCPNGSLTISKNSLNASVNNVLKYTEAFQVNGIIGNIDTIFHIDTGSNLTLHIPKSIVEKLDFTDTENKRIGRKANTEYVIQEAVLQSRLNIGDVEVRNQIIGYSENSKYINVGMGFLKNYKISIDQRNKLFKIE